MSVQRGDPHFELVSAEEVGFVDHQHDASSSFVDFCGEGVLGLGDQAAAVEAGDLSEVADDGGVEASGADGGVAEVDDAVTAGVEIGERGSHGDGLAGADSDGVRLQQLRGLLPCEVTVRRGSHPLCGERLAALSFQRKGGELRLVVVLPDGTPGMIAAADTDVFGDPLPSTVVTALSVEGVRRFRMLVESHLGRAKTRRRPRPWKAVRHRTGLDPFHQILELYSAHTTEQAALRALDRARAAVVRTSGYEVAARWSWAVVNDPAGLLVDPVGRDGEGRR